MVREAMAGSRRSLSRQRLRFESTQVIGAMIRQLGHLFLQPMLDAMWRQLAGPDASGADKPVLEVRVHAPGPPAARP